MKEIELLKDVIRQLENLEEISYQGYQEESIYGGGGHYEDTYMSYFDKEDRDQIVDKLKEVYKFFETVEK